MGGQCAHAHTFHRRVTDHGFRQSRNELFSNGIQVFGRHDGAADGGAFLACFGGDFFRHFFHKQIELFVIRADIGAEDGAVERVSFGIEGDAVLHQIGMHPQLGSRVCRAGERDDIGHVESVEQIAGAANHQLQTAFGQQARIQHQTHCGFGEVTGGGGGLANARHACQKTGGEFFQQTPDGKVEGVDVHRHTTARHQNVCARKTAFFAQWKRRAFVNHIARRQFVAAHACIRIQSASTAIDVNPTVGFRGPGMR